MGQSHQALDRLSVLLDALPAENMPMTLSELDGYVTGILACTDVIAPSEWLPHVWGETGEANFPDQTSAEETISAVMAHYNSVANSMTQSLWVDPIYEVDPNSDETLWEPWIYGFARSMGLRPDVWATLLDQADEETQATILYESRPELSSPEPSSLPGVPFNAGPRPGRKDPCSCGSGRKYKQCCGRN